MGRSTTRIQSLTQVSTLDDDDILPTGPSSGDVAKGITFGNFKGLIETSDEESTTEVTGDYTQLITDHNIIITGPATLTLIQVSTAIHPVKIKSKLGGGDVVVTPFSGDTVDATTTLTLSSGVGQTLVPITLDWEVMG